MGKYIYCIVRSSVDRSFGAIGIGKEKPEVTTISYADLSMLVSEHPQVHIPPTAEAITTHERVIEAVMQEYNSLLPMRFCTIAKNEEEVRDLLERRYDEFNDLLYSYLNKVEYAVKAELSIPDMKKWAIKSKHKASLVVKRASSVEPDDIVTVEAVPELDALRQEHIMTLRRIFHTVKIDKECQLPLILNASILLERGRENELHFLLEEFDEKYNQNIMYSCTGPFPPYNFMDLVIRQAEWEL